MKRKVVFAIFCIFIMHKINSQNINWGKISESETMFYSPQILGQDEKYIYSLSLEKETQYLEKFDKQSFEKLYSKILEKPIINKEEAEFERIDLIAGKFIVFSSIYDDKAKESKIYATCFDSNTGEKSSENILVLNAPVEKKRRSEFNVFVSSNKKFLLINHYAYYKAKKEIKDEYKLLDQNLNTIAEKQETVNKEEIDYITYNFIVDNEGSFYYAKSYNSGDHYIVSYDANKKYEKWEEKIDLSDLKNKAKYSNVTFTINPNNDLVVSGYYTLNDKEIEGCFFMKIDNKSKEIIINKVNTFETSFKEEFLSLKEIKKNKEGEIPNLFNSINILNKADGGIILIGEKFQHTIYQSNYVVTHIFTFDDMIVLNLSPKGELLWTNRIPKRQYYKANGNFQSMERILKKVEFYSFLAGADKDSLYIYYNEHPKNLKVEKKEKLTYIHNIEDAVPVKIAIGLNSGDRKLEMVKDLSQNNIYFKPMVSYQKEQNSDIIVLAQYKKKYKLGTLSFK
jgi:hypothetical protein